MNHFHVLNNSVNHNFASRISKIIVLLVVGVLFYLLNIYTPLFADDYSYSFSFATGERIETVSDIIESQMAHYSNTNGRFVTHFFAQIFLLLGKPTFNFINVFIFLMLGILLCFHAKGTFRHITTSELVITYAIIFLSTPAFGQSFLWLDGSATYSLGLVISLAYLIPFRRILYKIRHGLYTHNSLLWQILMFIIMFIFGVFAGNTSENVGAALIVYIVICLIYAKIHSYKIQFWMLGIGNILGTILSVISQGTQNRLASTGGLTVVGMVRNIFFITSDFLIYLKLPCFFCIFFVIAYLFTVKANSTKDFIEHHFEFIIYFISALTAAFSMILSTQFPKRAWSIVVVLSTVVILIGFNHFIAKLPKASQARSIVAIFLVGLSLGAYLNGYVRLKAMSVFHQSRVDRIVQAVQNEESYIEISAIASDSPFSVFDPTGDLNYDSSKWPNTAMARYYGIKEIKRAAEDFDY